MEQHRRLFLYLKNNTDNNEPVANNKTAGSSLKHKGDLNLKQLTYANAIKTLEKLKQFKNSEE